MDRGHIGTLARSALILSGREMVCEVCGYSKHVDACHRKAVAVFSDDTKIREINHIDNLLWLCKNHHWELDHDNGVTNLTSRKNIWVNFGKHTK